MRLGNPHRLPACEIDAPGYAAGLAGAPGTSVVQLKDHIDAIISSYNEGAAPFIRKKTKIRQRNFRHRRNRQL